MPINLKRSFTEYSVTATQSEFVIGFKDYQGDKDVIHVTVNDTDAEDAGFTVTRINSTTVKLVPDVPVTDPVSVVRLQRETNIDASFHRFSEGAKWNAQSMDENFEQVLHSQQETRDGFNKLRDDVLPLVDGLEEALQQAQDASEAAQDAASAAEAAAASVASRMKTVDSVAELKLYTPVDGELVYVKGYYAGTIVGGGVFKAVLIDSSVDDGGLVIVGNTGIRYLRIHSKDLSLEDFGYKSGLSVTNNTSIVGYAFNGASGCTLRLPSDAIIQVNPLSVQVANCNVIGNNTTIQFVSNTSNVPFILSNSTVTGLNLDGSGNSIGASHSTYGVAGFTALLCIGQYTTVSECTFKNFTGLENNFQYGLSVLGSTRSVVTNCRFDNIRTRTNTAAGAGFCGGMFVFQPTGIVMIPTQHTVHNCLFNDIYTIKNAANTLYDDSDGVRTYFNEYGLDVVGYDNAVKQSTITVSNCTFKNVLKSSCKLQHLKATIKDCVSVVDSLKDQGQTWVYAGFRYQYGDDITIENCSVSGYYRFGVYVSGVNSTVTDLKFNGIDLSGAISDQAAMQVGQLAEPINVCTITNLSGNGYGMNVLGCNYLNVRDSNFSRPRLGNVLEANFTNCVLNELMNNGAWSTYNPAIGKLTYIDCSSNSVSTTLAITLSSTTPVELFIKGGVHTIGACLVFSTYPFSKVTLKDTTFNLSTNTAATNRRFLQGSTSMTNLTIDNVVINDSRTSTPDLLISSGGSSNKVTVSNLTFNGSSSNTYTYLLYLIPTSAFPKVTNFNVNGCTASARAIAMTNTGGIVDGLNCLYTGAYILINQTSGTGQYVVHGMRGTLAATHISTGGAGTVTLHETATAKW